MGGFWQGRRQSVTKSIAGGRDGDLLGEGSCRKFNPYLTGRAYVGTALGSNLSCGSVKRTEIDGIYRKGVIPLNMNDPLGIGEA